MNNGDKLTGKIKKYCPDSMKCTLVMKDHTDFKWDKVYIIKEGVSLEETNKIIGFNYPYFEDIADRIIFVKGNQVVYHQDEFINPSSTEKERVLFKYPNDSKNYMVFSNDVVFKLIKSKVNTTSYYE